MKLTPHLFCLGVVMLSAASAEAKPAYVASTVNLRAAPGTSNEIIAKIPGGSLVDADNCTDGWCAVTWQGKSGFAIQTALDLSGRVPRRPAQAYAPGAMVEGPPVYDAPPVYYAERPGYYYGYRYWRPYWGPRWGGRRYGW